MLTRWIHRGAGRLPLAAHVLFWGATYAFFVLYFGREAGSFNFGAHATDGGGAFRPSGHGLFALYGFYALVGSVYLELVVIVASFMLLAGYDLRLMNPSTLDVIGLVVGLYVVVFVAVAANLAVRWHTLRIEHDEAERARLEAELALREAELDRLKTQMQPHFLFNTLNNLYGLTLEGSDDAPEVVLRISEMLDYVLYRCNEPLVPLQAEIEHLKTYLELERLRYGDRMSIQLRVDGELPAGRIAPLLLSPFVENAFKHGQAGTASSEAWVDVRVGADDAGMLCFEVENSTTSQPAEECDAAGIGIENVRRRLRLMYPDVHELAVDQWPGRHVVRLRVPIHPIKNGQYAEEAVG